jgi:hypothetical protein
MTSVYIDISSIYTRPNFSILEKDMYVILFIKFADEVCVSLRNLSNDLTQFLIV